MKNKDNKFKYFLEIKKAFEESGDWYVQGVASGTFPDRHGQKMSKNVIQKFIDKINEGIMSGNPMKLTDGHPENGPILADVGDLVYAEMLDDEYDSMFIKAKVDQDHPAVPYLMKQINKGKQFAFSIEGYLPGQEYLQTVYDENTGTYIQEITDIIPDSITITSKPSYIPTFMEVVMKAYEKSRQKENVAVENNITINKSIMDENKTETTENQEVAESQKVTEEVKPEVATEEVVETEKPAEVATENEEVKIEKSHEAPKLSETSDNKEFLKILKSIQSELAEIKVTVSGYKGEMEKAVIKSEESELVLKSIHSELETIKDLPLQKRSMIVKKSYEDRTEEKPTFKSVAEANLKS